MGHWKLKNAINERTSIYRLRFYWRKRFDYSEHRTKNIADKNCEEKVEYRPVKVTFSKLLFWSLLSGPWKRK